MDRATYAAAERMLRKIAARTIEYARARNKAGVIRMRYLARHIRDLMPLARDPRITHQNNLPNDFLDDDGDEPTGKH